MWRVLTLVGQAQEESRKRAEAEAGEGGDDDSKEDSKEDYKEDSKDDDAIAKIRDAIKSNLDLPPFVTIDYKRISASRRVLVFSLH